MQSWEEDALSSKTMLQLMLTEGAPQPPWPDPYPNNGRHSLKTLLPRRTIDLAHMGKGPSTGRKLQFGGWLPEFCLFVTACVRLQPDGSCRTRAQKRALRMHGQVTI